MHGLLVEKTKNAYLEMMGAIKAHVKVDPESVQTGFGPGLFNAIQEAWPDMHGC